MKRPILLWPDPKLRLKSSTVTDFDGPFQTLVDDMFETMFEAEGIGLAAIQVGVPLRVFVCCVGPLMEVYVNPEIKVCLGEPYSVLEGCLSVPGYFANVERYPQVNLTYQDRYGRPHREDTGLTEGPPERRRKRAHVIQHETEHTNGDIFLDHLSVVHRMRARKLLKKR